MDATKYTGTEIAIIGMAGKFPGAEDINEFWQNLLQGKESIKFYSDQELLAAKIPENIVNNENYIKTGGGILKDKECFDASFFNYSDDEADLMVPQSRLMHETIWHGLEDASINPEKYPGLVGLYVGYSSDFEWQAYSHLSGKIDDFGYLPASLLINNQFSATKIAYNLNLRGPSVFVQSACSTSLLAVHMAVRSLLTGECHVAIAGGATVGLMPKYGYFYQEGMIASKDGHCRPFDKNSSGSVGGNGVGVVVLKLLKHAIRDNDNIHAIIKGSASNNDGRRKIGYSAPSVEGQAEVIKKAIQISKVAPESIGYIETHGTGTDLGDIIEFEALKLAFNSQQENSCALGAVKANIGHLDSAAGIAGLIKTVLILKNKKIPPSINFTQPNPKLDFYNSPFYINKEIIDWAKDGNPRRAGVSSFGIGGTNVHVLLEESPQTTQLSAKNNPYYSVLISAQNNTALKQMTLQLKSFATTSSEKLEDISFSFYKGRKALKYRKSFICSSLDELMTQCETSLSRDKIVEECKSGLNPIFVFPGIGNFYRGIAKEFIDNFPKFSEAVDYCISYLPKEERNEIFNILYHTEKVTNNHEISFLDEQMALFIFHIALFKLLDDFKIKPKMVMGYSFGEYAAAVVSGMMDVHDAINLIQKRGKLIASTIEGAMLSIPLKREEIDKYSTHTFSIAIDNGDSCIVSGSKKELELLQKELASHRILTLNLSNKFALHSTLMNPILDDFRKEASKVEYKLSQIPFVSGVDGQIVGKIDGDYLTNQISQTVKFADSTKYILRNVKNPLFIDLGPGTELLSIFERFKSQKSKFSVFSLVAGEKMRIPVYKFFLSGLSKIWIKGYDVQFDSIYHQNKKVSVPLYTFERKKYWPDLNKLDIKNSFRNELERRNISQWFYSPLWQQCIASKEPRKDPTQEIIIVFEDPACLSNNILQCIDSKEQQIIKIKISMEFSEISKDCFGINPSNKSDYILLFKTLQILNFSEIRIIHTWSLTNNKFDFKKRGIEKSQQLGYFSLMLIAQSLGDIGIKNRVRISLITNNLYRIQPKSKTNPFNSTLIGAAKIVPLEYDNISCAIHDFDYDELIHPDFSMYSEMLGEIFNDKANTRVFRNFLLWKQVYGLIQNDYSLPVGALKNQGVYIITGGFGGMGLAIAKYLAKNYNSKIILINRSKLPDRRNWENTLQSEQVSNEVKSKIRDLIEIERNASKLLLYTTDISNELMLQSIYQEIKSELNAKIDGIFHAAGAIDYGGIIQNRSDFSTGDNYTAKIKGTIVIDKVFYKETPDFFILFSSIGNILFDSKFGQIDYATANEFMDHYANSGLAKCKNIIAINWADWKKTGMSVRAHLRNHKDEDINGTNLYDAWIDPDEALQAIEKILVLKPTNVAISTQDLTQKIQKLENRLIDKNKPVDVNEGERIKGGNDGNKLTKAKISEIYCLLQNIMQKILNKDSIYIEDDFFLIGGDSLKGITLLSQIHKLFNVKLSLPQLYRARTLREIAQIILWDNAQDSEYTVFNAGAGAAIFCFPPLISYGICYNHLAEQLENNQIVAFNFIPDEERMDKYCDIIYSFQKEGDLVLLGYSGGGNIAIQVAERLEERGRKIKDVIVIDGFIWESEGDISSDEVTKQNLSDFILEIDEEIEKYGISYMRNKILDRIIKYDQFQQQQTDIKPINSSIHLIKSIEKVSNKPPKDWRNFTHFDVNTRQGYGKHGEMINNKYIAKNSEIIKTIIL